MLLTELTNFPAKHDETFAQVIKRFLEKHGAKMYEGNQATVIDRGSFVWRTWFNDKGYERFLKYIEQHKGNKHLPKILSKVREESIQFKGMPKGMTIKYVKLEKLTEVPIGIFGGAVDTIYNYFRENAKSQLPDSIEELAELSLSMNKRQSAAENEDIKEEILAHPQFFLTVLDLMKKRMANDLASGNIMYRGSIPVITDPLSDN